ncbi:MAG: TetR/AcrR family transcriptional regulator [Myxococcota bacterium]
MEPARVDRRVARTRQTLRDALVALILDRGWDQISVKDVCDAANVGRSTFYAHFGDKEELLTSGFDHLLAHLRAAGTPGPEPALRFVAPLIAHAIEHRPLFRALVGKHSGRVVERRFRQVVATLVGEELADRDLGGLPRDVAVRFVSGGVVELLSAALDGPPIVPDALDRQVQQLVGRVILHPVMVPTRRVDAG